MYLPGSTIKEIATNPEEAGKFVFEVIPGRRQKWGQRYITLPFTSGCQCQPANQPTAEECTVVLYVAGEPTPVHQLAGQLSGCALAAAL